MTMQRYIYSILHILTIEFPDTLTVEYQPIFRVIMFVTHGEAQNNAAQFKIQTSPPAKAMEPARPIVNLSRDFELSVSEVIGYLKEYGGNAIPTLPPLQPKGGG